MSLPAELRGVLPAETAEAWERIAPVLPAGFELAGGTALAVRRVAQRPDLLLHRIR